MAASGSGDDPLARMEEDSAAVLGNVRALRGLLKDCQVRIRELEAGHAALGKGYASQTVPASDLHPALPRAPSLKLNIKARTSLVSKKDGKEQNYVGSYGKLVSFLEAARIEGSISDADASSLLAAVEDISSLGSGKAVDKNDALFAGTSKQDFANTMASMGIQDEAGDSSPKKEKTKQGNFQLEERYVLESIAVLQDNWFNCRQRKDISADAFLVVHALSKPANLLDRYHIVPNTLHNWTTAIAGVYQQNPYHCWSHALDVFQLSYSILTRGKIVDYFNNQDILALLIAAVAHDVGHPGVTSAFLIATKNDIAITYNDKSPLENMHACVMFQTLRREGMNFMGDVAQSDFKVFRTKVIDAILATDMAHHFELVDRFAARVSTQETKPFLTGTKDNKEKSNASKDDRRMLIQAFTHMADLGHCCRPWDIHKAMVVSLETEFFMQGDKEREMGMPVMPLMDRTKDSAAASQSFFLAKIVTPLFDACMAVLATELGNELQEQTAVNGQKWAALIEKHGKLTAKELIDKEK